MHCPAGCQYAVSETIAAEKMKWQVVRNKIAVSRYYRLKEWPWRFISRGGCRREPAGLREKVHLKRGVPFFFVVSRRIIMTLDGEGIDGKRPAQDT